MGSKMAHGQSGFIQKLSWRAEHGNPECRQSQWAQDRRVTSFLAMTEIELGAP
jgi:hypothetical protein